MKHLVVLLALLSCAFAQNMVAMYAGTNNGTTWTPPVLNEDASPPTCTPGSATTYGVYFDYNVTTAGVFHVAVMTEGSFKSYVEVFAYTHPFDPNSPCTNVIIKEWEKEIGEGGGPVIADFAYMGVGRYWFVVTSNTANTIGQIAIHVYPPLATGQTDAASPVWDAAYGVNTCTGGAGGSGDPHFGLFTWTQNGTGQYDIVAGWYNASDTDFSYTYLALYSGAQAAAAITTDSCANYLYADYDSSNGLTLWNRTLTNGQQYTLVTSPEYDSEYGYWGIWVRPTIAGTLWNTPAWNQPERDSNCTASSYTTTSWFADDVVATGQVTIIDTQTLTSSQGFSYVDTYSWFFRGNQTTSSPPPTCGGKIITYGDTGDVTPVYGVTIPGRIYTVVVSTYSGSNNVGDFGLFTMSGTPIGNIPSSDETTGDGADGGDGEDEDEDGDDEDDGAAGVSVSILLTAVLAIFARFF